MSQTNEYRLAITTAADGSATVYTPKVSGWIERVILDIDTLTAGAVDITITDDQDPAMPIITLTNAAADAVHQPRRLVQDSAGADIAGAYAMVYVHNARIKVVVAQGGNVTAGVVKILVVDTPTQVI